MATLTDKVALITGSDSGIGQATAIEFAREGADVVVNYLHDHSPSIGSSMKRWLRSAGWTSS